MEQLVLNVLPVILATIIIQWIVLVLEDVQEAIILKAQLTLVTSAIRTLEEHHIKSVLLVIVATIITANPA